MTDKMINTANDDVTRPMPAQVSGHDGSSETTQMLPATPDPGEMPTATLPVTQAADEPHGEHAPHVAAAPAKDDPTVVLPKQQTSQEKNETREVPYLTGNARADNVGPSDSSNTSDGPFRQPAGNQRSDGPQPQNRQVPLYAGGVPAAGPYQTSEPLPRKSGPNAGAMVLGALTMLLGVIALVAGLQFPYIGFTAVDIDGRVAFAALCGIVGVALIVVAVIWSVVKIVTKRSRREHKG